MFGLIRDDVKLSGIEKIFFLFCLFYCFRVGTTFMGSCFEVQELVTFIWGTAQAQIRSECMENMYLHVVNMNTFKWKIWERSAKATKADRSVSDRANAQVAAACKDD